MDDKEELLDLIDENTQSITGLKSRLEDVENKFFGPDPNISPDIARNLKQFIDANVTPTVAIAGRSHKSSNQSINDVSSTKVVWEANDYANGITWDSGNNQFTVVTAGYYFISASVLFANTVDGSLYGIRIFLNGSEITFHQAQSGNAGGTISTMIFDTQSLAVGDHITIYVFHNSGAARDLSAGSVSNCYFNVAKIN